MSLLDKSAENKKMAQKCLDLQAYNAGISRAYYAVFQRVEHTLHNNAIFNYRDFLRDNQIVGDHIPHGKMQQAMVTYILKSGKKVNLVGINVYDNLYRKRRKADYTDEMFTKNDLDDSIKDMNTIFGIIALQESA
jgi:uncharacterized protein (UPF0332 family)